mgnify:CR=1 FL=1
MTDDVDLDARIATLDLEGKVRLLTGATMFTLQSDDSIGLGAMAFSDGPTGVRGLEFVGDDAARANSLAHDVHRWRLRRPSLGPRDGDALH